MAETHLDHPGEITWFSGYGPLPIVGPCPHICEHNAVRNIAWGPDFDHYTLNQCIDCGCRGWAAEYPFGEGPQFKLGDMLAVGGTE